LDQSILWQLSLGSVDLLVADLMEQGSKALSHLQSERHEKPTICTVLEILVLSLSMLQIILMLACLMVL
jgi:hypothetical protein